MSSEEQPFGQHDVAVVSDFYKEPSYISEVARKLRDANLPLGYNFGELERLDVIGRTWGDLSQESALVKVNSITGYLLEEQEPAYDFYDVEYDTDGHADEGQSQSVGSMHVSVQEGETTEWMSYVVVQNVREATGAIGENFSEEGYNELASRMDDYIDPSISPDEKIGMVKGLSRDGNKVSMHAERIMQDSLERQFKNYERMGYADYHDPGTDFWVRDEGRREHGLVVEVSTRWENPIGQPYINSKVEKLLEMEEEEKFGDTIFDLVIIAPKFTDEAKEKYEDPDDPSWHAEPEGNMVHLHRVPTLRPDIYQHFATDVSELVVQDDDEGGYPVIIQDDGRTRTNISRYGHVSDNYPVVDSDYLDFRRALSAVRRNSSVLTESRYRHMVRESIEPLLWEFLRPYKVEQFLIDMYWDKELTQSDIGKLVDRSGSTIGDWMRKWGVMRRGTGAPELSSDAVEIWRRMYEGLEPFPEQFSGYRIQAEYNRHPLWSLQEWREWYNSTTEDERRDIVNQQDSFKSNLDYTILVGAKDRLLPSYTFIMKTLDEEGVDIRPPDEAPRVPYSAYPSRDALEYMINREMDTIVDVSE